MGWLCGRILLLVAFGRVSSDRVFRVSTRIAFSAAQVCSCTGIQNRTASTSHREHRKPISNVRHIVRVQSAAEEVVKVDLNQDKFDFLVLPRHRHVSSRIEARAGPASRVPSPPLRSPPEAWGPRCL